MAPGVRGRFGDLGARIRRRDDPAETNERLRDLPQTASSDEIAERLDIGAAAFVGGPRYGYDIDVADVVDLLGAVARSAARRGQAVHLQVPGRCLPLSLASVAERVDDIGGRPRLRLLVGETGGHLIENVAVELWKQADRAYRSLSDDAHVRLMLPGAAAPRHGPAPTEDTAAFPIDVVYTWVDATDVRWRELAAPYMDIDAIDADLYTQTDELRYSLRSLETFAPWVNHVYVLSNCAPPGWFSATDRVTWVDHEEVAPPGILPLFNAAAIETLLPHVPGLEEHFIYLNDDVMLWDSATPSTFFTWDGRSISRLATNSSVVYLQQLVEAGQARPSQHSRVNAARLLQQRHGVFHSRLHGHVPHALRRSEMVRIERDYADEIATTRAARTRSNDETGFIPYLYHHDAHVHGSAVQIEAPLSFVTVQNYQRPAMLRALRQTPFACFQESRGSSADADYQAFKRRTLAAALPLPSSAEHVER